MEDAPEIKHEQVQEDANLGKAEDQVVQAAGDSSNPSDICSCVPSGDCIPENMEFTFGKSCKFGSVRCCAKETTTTTTTKATTMATLTTTTDTTTLPSNFTQ